MMNLHNYNPTHPSTFDAACQKGTQGLGEECLRPSCEEAKFQDCEVGEFSIFQKQLKRN